MTNGFRYRVCGCELWARLSDQQIVTTGKTRKEAVEQAKQAVKDYERRRKEGEFDDWYNSEDGE